MYGFDAGGGQKLLIYAVYPQCGPAMHAVMRKDAKPNLVSGTDLLDIDGNTEIIWPGDAPMQTIAKFCRDKDPLVVFGPHHGAPFNRNLKSTPPRSITQIRKTCLSLWERETLINIPSLISSRNTGIWTKCLLHSIGALRSKSSRKPETRYEPPFAPSFFLLPNDEDAVTCKSLECLGARKSIVLNSTVTTTSIGIRFEDYTILCANLMAGSSPV